MEYKEFENILEEEAREMGLEIKQPKQFYEYMQLLLEWNEKINLTAITEPKEIIVKHFLDSLTIQKYIKQEDKIIDVGTGAGFPGVPLAIENSNNIVLLDSLNKRINFLNDIKEKLNLKNVENTHNRAEDAAKMVEYREKFDVAVSRAVAPMNILVEYLLPFVKKGGKVLCMKGPKVNEEIELAKNAIKILGGELEKIEQIEISEEKMQRNIVIIKKVNQTPEKYPRKAGIPSKEPL